MWHKIRITFSGLKRPKVISNFSRETEKTYPNLIGYFVKKRGAA